MNFVGIGGGEIPGWSFKTKDANQSLYQTKEIDKYIVSLAKKEKVKLLFIGTASKENPIYYEAVKKIYSNLGCETEYLEILSYLDQSNSINIEKNIMLNDFKIDDIRQKILSADIIYIGGGNTKFMLNKWHELEIDKILIEAYNKGIIISGYSAGCYSFFKYNYELIKGFGIINAIICVHYDEKSEEKINQFYETIKQEKIPGIALDNGIAIHYFDNKFKIIKSIKQAKAYKIIYKDDKLIKQELEENTEYEV